MSRAVIAICSNKGGVGKTTVATNLAIYLRALYDDLPVLLVGLDDQSVIDRMFRVRPAAPGEGNLKHGWAERSLQRVIQLGQYGVHFVPPPPDTALLKHRAEDPATLRRLVERSGFEGAVLIDTKSDLEALTRNALHAADLAVLPVADWTSLEEAGKVFDLVERGRLHVRPRVLLTLVDHRARAGSGEAEIYERLVQALRDRGFPRFRTHLSRSPKVEALNSAERNPGSILHHAAGTRVYAEMRALAEEVAAELHLESATAAAQAAAPVAAAAQGSFGSVKRAFLRGLREGQEG